MHLQYRALFPSVTYVQDCTRISLALKVMWAKFYVQSTIKVPVSVVIFSHQGLSFAH